MSRWWRRIFLPLLLAILVVSVALAGADLDFFDGMWQGNNTQVRLIWQTSAEVDHDHFDIWRSTTNLPIVGGQIDTSQAVKINSSPIVNPAGPCNTSGASYEYIDRSVSPFQGVYYYYLESHNCDGIHSSFFGEGSAGLEVRQATPPPSLSPTLLFPLLAR